MEEIEKYNGIYQEIFKEIKDEKLIVELHKLFWGDAVQFPKYLYNSDYVAMLASKEVDIKKRRQIAKSHGYSYDTISKKIKKFRVDN